MKYVIKVEHDAGGEGMNKLVAYDKDETFITNGGYSGRKTDLSIDVGRAVRSLTLKADGTIELEIGIIQTKIG